MSKTDGIGVWKWNEDPFAVFEGFGVGKPHMFSFSCAGASFGEIYYSQGEDLIQYDTTTVYRNGAWVNEDYRTIDITSAVPASLITHLQNNAVYQEPAPQYLDEAGLRQFFTKTKTYIDNSVNTKITTRLTSINNLLTNLDSGTGVS